MTAAGNGEILRLLPRVSRASVLLVVAFLAASCATEQTDSSAPAVAFATAPSPRATSAPIITRLSIPRQTDALRLKVAPDHRHVLAMGGDVATFFDLSGNTLATVDRRGLGLPAGVHAKWANLTDQSPDRRVAFLLVGADRPLSDSFNGFGVLSLIDDSVSEPTRPARAYAVAWITGHEQLMVPWETVAGRRTVTA